MSSAVKSEGNTFTVKLRLPSTSHIGTSLLQSKPSVKSSNVRHCAFCLEIITVMPVKLCGRCKKRAYCSKKCQVLDWKISGTGQRHKNWCGVYEYGEEDVDWEVVPVINKGLGIVARKLLPAGYRIIVEPAFNDVNDHPGIGDLEPKGSPLEVKFSFNGVHGYRGKPLIALRIARVNHSCLPNAGASYDSVAHVEILFAQRDIHPGEEVTMCYYTYFNDLGPSTISRPDVQSIHSKNPSEDDFGVNQIILKRWGIICPKDCFCKERKTRKLVLKGKRLYDEMHVSTAIGRIDDALNAGDKILIIYEKLNISWALKDILLFHLFKIGRKVCINNRGSYIPRCAQYLADFYEIRRVISPFSEITSVCDEWFKKAELADASVV